MINKCFQKFIFCLAIALLALCILAAACTITPKRTAIIERISSEEARAKVQVGEATLVCSYDDDKCQEMLLDGAILRSEFERRVDGFSKNHEIIFYCG